MSPSEDYLREVTPLGDDDCFMIISRPQKRGFDFPLHVHPEFELNYLEGAAGALRIAGDSVEEIENHDLVLVAGGTKHAYANHNCLNESVSEITIQFHSGIFDSMLNTRHFKTIRKMFEDATQGIVFSSEMIVKIVPHLTTLSENNTDSFHNFLHMVEILKILSLDSKMRRLSSVNNIVDGYYSSENERLERILLFMHANYKQQLMLAEVAEKSGMSEASLTRFLKKRTGKTFIDNLNDIRISQAVCKLIDTHDTITEICYNCGFNNISNFNRIFKKRKECTPTEYREKYERSRFKV